LFSFAFKSPLFKGGTELDQDKIKELYEILSLIEENYFVGGKWIAGESLSIADFAYASTVAGLIVSLNQAASVSFTFLFLRFDRQPARHSKASPSYRRGTKIANQLSSVSVR
jgi:glutathione S-transferase